jgi:hypothetical protein
MRPARPAAILVLACAPAFALAACGQGVGTSARAPATSAATLAGAAPSQPVSSHPTRLPATSSQSPHSAPGRSSLPPVRKSPRDRTSTSAAIHADHVVGHGTPGSCTSQAVVRAVAAGGVIAFSCGPRPVTIVMTATAPSSPATAPARAAARSSSSATTRPARSRSSIQNCATTPTPASRPPATRASSSWARATR